jgi:hypothetical protein
MGNGIRMIARMCGGLSINGVAYIYDYAQDKLVDPRDLKQQIKDRLKARTKARKEANEKARQAQTGMEI